MGEGKGDKKVTETEEANDKRRLNTENKLRVDWGWGKGESG